jgi:hypothetical protein
MSYDFTILNNTHSIVTVIQAANTFTGGIYGLFIIIIVGVVTYFGLRMFEPTRECLVAATFASTLTSIFLRVLNVVDTMYVTACIILLIGAVVMLINRE